MNKQEIINVLQEVLITHETWADQGQVLIDGINLDRLMEPVKLNECDFSIWNETNKNNIINILSTALGCKGNIEINTKI